MSDDRKARIANGLLILVSAALSLVEPRFLWITVFMGVSLIYSGASGFCGWIVIFQRLRSATSSSVSADDSRSS